MDCQVERSIPFAQVFEQYGGVTALLMHLYTDSKRTEIRKSNNL